DPKRALEFLNNEYHQDPFWLRALHREQPKTIGDPGQLILNLPELTKLVYNHNRFSQIIVIVSDYSMPGLNGIQFSQQVKTRDGAAYPVIKFILLTGVLDSPMAVLEDLNAFYKKDEPIDKLLSRAKSFKVLYFEDASLGLANYLLHDPKNRTVCLMDDIFINFLKKLMDDKNICEYYLVDAQGSYLLLDKNANMSWFLVRNETGMAQSIKFAQQCNAPQGVIHAIERREKLLYIPDEAGFQKTTIDWNDYLHPVQVLEGREKYYTAFVNDLKHHHIERDKIVSFKDYLKSC
ncbi:MAG: hypothetical protein JSS53_01225, partial [Proteobacteria bacterium]|nr:hypothetical protein [Pseudomonadota bacterium]